MTVVVRNGTVQGTVGWTDEWKSEVLPVAQHCILDGLHELCRHPVDPVTRRFRWTQLKCLHMRMNCYNLPWVCTQVLELSRTSYFYVHLSAHTSCPIPAPNSETESTERQKLLWIFPTSKVISVTICSAKDEIWFGTRPGVSNMQPTKLLFATFKNYFKCKNQYQQLFAAVRNPKTYSNVLDKTTGLT